jgi:hypothetical protein
MIYVKKIDILFYFVNLLIDLIVCYVIYFIYLWEEFVINKFYRIHKYKYNTFNTLYMQEEAKLIVA